MNRPSTLATILTPRPFDILLNYSLPANETKRWPKGSCYLAICVSVNIISVMISLTQEQKNVLIFLVDFRLTCNSTVPKNESEPNAMLTQFSGGSTDCYFILTFQNLSHGAFFFREE